MTAAESISPTGGCAPEDTAENLERIEKIFAEVNANGITEEELTQAKNKVSSRIVLRSERPMGRLGSLGSNWPYRGEYRSVEDDRNGGASDCPQEIKYVKHPSAGDNRLTDPVGPLESLNGKL